MSITTTLHEIYDIYRTRRDSDGRVQAIVTVGAAFLILLLFLPDLIQGWLSKRLNPPTDPISDTQ